MPGYAIHIAIAQEYIKKHPKEVINKEEFLKGTIAPDLESNKNKSHYGNWGNYKIDIYLDKFLKDTKIKIATKDNLDKLPNVLKLEAK